MPTRTRETDQNPDQNPEQTQCMNAEAPISRGRRAFLRGVVLVGAMAVTLGLSGLAPEPEPVPRRWELQVEAGPLRITTVTAPNVGARSYIYFTYKAVNNSGQDVLFAPAFELSNGQGQTYRSGRDVPQQVTAELVTRTQNPFVQDQIAVIGDILQGEEHAKEGIVIWPLVDFSPATLTVYAAGFSGESKTVVSPNGKDKFVLRKTLRLQFEAPGDLTSAGSRSLEIIEKQWIMR